VVKGIALAANPLEFLRESLGIGIGVVGEARQAGAASVVGAAVRPVFREKQLAYGGNVQWRPGADDLHHPHHRAVARRALDVDHLVFGADREVYRLSKLLMEALHVREGLLSPA